MAFAHYQDIRGELESFSSDILQKDEIIVLSKVDIVGTDESDRIVKELRKQFKGKTVFVISAAARQGLEELKDFLIAQYAKQDIAPAHEDLADTMKIYDLKNQMKDESFKILHTGEREFTIVGERIEQIARMTNMQNFEAVARIYDILEKMRILSKIRTMLFSDMQEYFFE